MASTRIIYNATGTEVYKDDITFDTTDETELAVRWWNFCRENMLIRTQGE